LDALVPYATSTTFNTTLSFKLPGADTSLSLRVLADRTIVETFIASGRAVVTTPVLNPGLHHNRSGAFLFAGGGGSVGVKSASAWAMGCGWARYP
jgi:hypothetical protein